MIEAFIGGVVAEGSLLIGCLVALTWRVSSRLLGLIMAFGAGVLLSAVAYELMAKAVIAEHGLEGVIFGFVVGAATFTIGDLVIERLGGRAEAEGEERDTGPSLLLGATLDGVPEAVVLGFTIVSGGSISLALVAAVFISNVPEGIAGTSELARRGWGRARLFGAWGAIVLASGIAASLGYLVAASVSTLAAAFCFAFAAGAVLTMLATTMMPEAYRRAARAAGPATILGFAVALVLQLAEFKA